MEDTIFKREKVRRDLQEALNAVDEAIAFEGDEIKQSEKDLIWCLKLFPYSLEISSLIETFSEPLKKAKDA